MIKKTLYWKETNNNTVHKLELQITIHPFNNGKIIINCPGADGSLDGYESKYSKLADYIIGEKLGAVVRMPNPYNPFGWDKGLRQVIAYVLENSKEICGSIKPEIYLMGTSAGAGVISVLAWEYPEVKKILLLEPAIIFDKAIIIQSLEKYKGKVVIITGSEDNALGINNGKVFYDASINTSKREIIVLENCDHQFTGERNGRIFSQAPFYAFGVNNLIVFPDYKGGIKLYD